jgi:hypothetical protein
MFTFHLIVLLSVTSQNNEMVAMADELAADFTLVTDSSPYDSTDLSTNEILTSATLTDIRQDSLYDPVQADPDCSDNDGDDAASCYEPPKSTLDQDDPEQQPYNYDKAATIDATCSYGGDDPDNQFLLNNKQQDEHYCSLFVDKHWGSDSSILYMRETLRRSGSGASQHQSSKSTTHSQEQSTFTKPASSSSINKRPPIFLLPGLASTRLVAWRYKSCPQHPLLGDIKVQDYVWLNINLVLQMSSISNECFKECLTLGWNQTDSNDSDNGCKLRPDEGLDAISSLSPGSSMSNMLIGGTNTVYAWLIQWLADNLGYDVTNIGKEYMTMETITELERSCAVLIL